MVQPRIEVSGLWKVFGGSSGPVVAIEDFDLSVADQEFLCVVGPSGCGKTTLLRILAGLERATAGRVVFRRTSAQAPAHSMVFQEQSIFPWMRVKDNVGYGLAMRRVPRRQREAATRTYLEKVGLTQFAHAFPHELSGGMKQRVSLARAFANDPEVLLMDEPFAALDEQTKVILEEELLRIWSETRKTVVYITHSIDEAIFLADRIIVMTSRPGRVKAVVPVPFGRPRSVYGVRADPAYATTVAAIWATLRDEVDQAMRARAAG